jgi:hypothetical protein
VEDLLALKALGKLRPIRTQAKQLNSNSEVQECNGSSKWRTASLVAPLQAFRLSLNSFFLGSLQLCIERHLKPLTNIKRCIVQSEFLKSACFQFPNRSRFDFRRMSQKGRLVALLIL